jgi:hypothetical protein
MSELKFLEPEVMSDEEKVKRTVAEIKAANDLYNHKLKLLNEKRNEINSLQVEVLEALQKASSLNEQYSMAVNAQLLKERATLQNEIKALKAKY